MVKKITIGHLYAKQMNVYGDMGNVITLRYRLEKRGYGVEYAQINSLGDLANIQPDILIGGGGQDSNQGLIQKDLTKYARELKQMCDDGLVALMICGMYQMFGHKFVLPDGIEIPGAGILDIETKAGDTRLIGNLIIETKLGKLVGFENHSGRTYLGNGAQKLGQVVKGAGNNGTTRDEGAVINNVFGSYLHGPALTKNPQFADELIKRALKRKGLDADLVPLDDFIEHRAASIAMKRPR